MDWSALAQIAPVLAAGFTKKPNVVANTINMTDKGKAAAYDRNLRDFGRELFSSGQVPDAQTVIMTANKYGVKPADAMDTINQFMSWRQKRQAMKQGEQALKQGELGLTQTQNTMDRQAAIDEWRQQYGEAPKQQWFQEGVRRGAVEPSPFGEMQGELRPGTVSAQNYATGLPEILQQGPMPQQQRTRLPGEELSVIPGQGIYDKAARGWVEQFSQGAGGGGYAGDQAKLLDDNRARWQVIMKAYMDPFGGVRDTEKYQEALEQFQQDEQRIMSGQLPSWATGQAAGAGGAGGPQLTHTFTRQGGYQPAAQK